MSRSTTSQPLASPGPKLPLWALLAFMVVAAIAVSIVNAEHVAPTLRWNLIVAGSLYLVALFDLLRRAEKRLAVGSLILSFSILLTLTGWISLLMVQLRVLGVVVLLFMPMMGIATAQLGPRGVAVVLAFCAFQFLGAAWLIGGTGLLPEAALGFTAGAAFVIMLVQLFLREQQSRQEVASLNARLWEQLQHAEALSTERERIRIAREIHDGLGHSLTTAGIQIEVAEARLASDPAATREALKRARDCVSRGLTDVRAAVSSLRRSPLDGRTLAEGIADLAADSECGDARIEYQCRGVPRRLPAPLSLTLYRAAQEGLSNVLKHARAGHVCVVLDFESDQYASLTIEDDGCGDREPAQDGFGLKSLRERATLVGGDFEATQRPDGGFRLRLSVPG